MVTVHCGVEGVRDVQCHLHERLQNWKVQYPNGLKRSIGEENMLKTRRFQGNL